MEGLKIASDAVRKATDSLVRSAQNTVQKPTSPRVKVDRFKQVRYNVWMKNDEDLQIFSILENRSRGKSHSPWEGTGGGQGKT